MQNSILDETEILQKIAFARSHGAKIVMTNGCFDILHPGHVVYLEKAKLLGHKLLIAINSDESVRRLKGSTRPINKLQDRITVLAALRSVNWIIPFTQDTPERLIKLIKPDILVKGGDYKMQEIVGADFVSGYGGEIIIIPFEKGFSSSAVIDKIKLNCS